MWRRILAWFGLRQRYAPIAGAGGRWKEAHYKGDPHCAPFSILYRTMTWRDRRAVASIETMAYVDGKHAAEALAQDLEPAMLAERIKLLDAEGAWQPSTADDIAELGGESGDAYLWARRLVLAPYYRELVEGDRAGKVLRRCASMRSALTSLLETVETA